MKQHEAVITSLERLGSVANLAQIYREALTVPGCAWGTRTPFASIRRIVQTRKEIYRIRAGLYGLSSARQAIEARGIFPQGDRRNAGPAAQEFGHGYYQGLLLEIGKLRGYQTFVPQQDRRKTFLGRPLQEVRTLSVMPHFTYADIVRRSQTIDVLWFNERMLPCAMYEVELSTGFQDSLVKFVDLLDFSARMVIVSDCVRRAEFEAKRNSRAFKDLRDRVQFLDLSTVARLHEHETERSHMEVVV
jgi:hypothetical protein